MTTHLEREREAATAVSGERTSVAALLGMPVMNAGGGLVGRVHDLAVSPAEDAFHIHGLLLGRAGKRMLAPVRLVLRKRGRLEMREGAMPEPVPDESRYLLLDREVLDQQIIDVHGHKVVRVNDIDLLWQTSHEGATELRIQQVEVGSRGAVRRLLKGLPGGAVRQVAERFGANAIPWEFVDLIDRDPSRRVRLKIEQDRLEKMHPSDLADILEELAPAEREALFISLDEEVAAETLEEIEPKLQQSLLAAIDSERVADIVEEMDPGAAADLLKEMPEAESDRILEEMEPDERREVEELLEFKGDSAAGLMTTEYVAVDEGATVERAVEALRRFEGDAETIAEVYLLDAAGKVTAAISVVRLVLARGEGLLNALPAGHMVCCHVETAGRRVAELFDKYNLRSMPVVNGDGEMVGVIHAEQVIALLREKI